MFGVNSDDVFCKFNLKIRVNYPTVIVFSKFNVFCVFSGFSGTNL